MHNPALVLVDATTGFDFARHPEAGERVKMQVKSFYHDCLFNILYQDSTNHLPGYFQGSLLSGLFSWTLVVISDTTTFRLKGGLIIRLATSE